MNSSILETMNFFIDWEKFVLFPIEDKIKHGKTFFFNELSKVWLDLKSDKMDLDLSEYCNVEQDTLSLNENIEEFFDNNLVLTNFPIQKIIIKLLPVNQAEVIEYFSDRDDFFENSFGNQSLPKHCLVKLTLDCETGEYSIIQSPLMISLFRKRGVSLSVVEESLLNSIHKNKEDHQFELKLNKVLNEKNISVTSTFEEDLVWLLKTLFEIRGVSNYVTKYYTKILSKDCFSLLKNVYSENFLSININGNDNTFSSFFLSDLQRIYNEIKKEKVGYGLKQYLNVNLWNNNEYRVNLLDENSLPIYEHLLSTTPIIRWPKKHSTSMMQQIAINSILQLGDQSGGFIQSIQGPAGSGKTTLVKDLIASILLKKVMFLSSDNFVQNKNVLPGGQIYYDFGDYLREYSILVCSSNNLAVENISLDLPTDPYLFEMDMTFFGKEYGSKTWGKISGALGKRENLRDFFDHIAPLITSDNFLMPDISDFQSCEFHNQVSKNIRKTEKISKVCNPESINDSNWHTSEKNIYQFSELGENEEFSTEDKDTLFSMTMKQYLLVLKKYKHVIRSNMQLARTYFFNKREFIDLTKDLNNTQKKVVIQSIFDTMFLLTPVQSSTYASVATFLRDISCEGIGWLIGDESGQTLPQAAVGAIYRCKRSVLLGDVHQVEPVNPFPSKLFVDILEKNFSDPLVKKSIMRSVSAQTFGDQSSIYGGYESPGKWVGIPLRVHRRCLRPQFDIANRTSYFGKMIYGTEETARKKIIPSVWIDVRGKSKSNVNHSIQAQNQMALKVIKRYVNKSKLEDNKIFVISPFKSVITEFKKELEKTELRYLGVEAGTVYSYQGRETDFVIFLLGGSCENMRAIRWAGEKGNIFNVAVTRARISLVIIGDKELWRQTKSGKIAIDTMEEFEKNN